jgi:SAM-dependent methyltransferase
MESEYRKPPPSGLRAFAQRVAASGGDRRSPRSREAFARVIAAAGADGAFLSVGGGPLRVHPRAKNLNIGPYPNVDVVATAYALPHADGRIAAIHCEAVLEHLEEPGLAVAEMFRALRPGGLVFAATPFLQSFHGYPGHFQNFTLDGHRRLFERAGFEILDAGPSVGPTFAAVDLLVNFAREFVPGRWPRAAASLAVAIAGGIVRPLDRWLVRHPNAHRLASTTFVLARKPGRESRAPLRGTESP